jgi:Flp pilus assembly protein TadB
VHRWLIYALAALVCLAYGYSSGQASERANSATALAKEQTKRRQAEQELRDAQERHAQQTQALHLDLDRARHRAAVESGRVQDAAKAAARRAREQCPAAAAAGLGEAAGDPIGVLADVLGRADDRAQLLAELADRRYLAGRACEREYDAARRKLSQN